MIGSSELLINPDGSVFHLHIKPEHLANNVIIVGDPGRVRKVADYFQKIEVEIQNREFVTITGSYNGQRISVISSGIGTDNIDIVMNELDALVNIDLASRTIKEEKQSLNIIRIGTSGGLQYDMELSEYVISRKAIGFDGLLNFYSGRNSVSDLDLEKKFKEFVSWNPLLTAPYVVNCSPSLFRKISGEEFTPGITISAPGFYGPQGRVLRLGIVDPQINKKLADFSYDNFKITNYEMECSAIYGLSALMGHQALTVCLIIADRQGGNADVDYQSKMEKLIQLVLERLTQ
jgi:Uridine phosphorylase